MATLTSRNGKVRFENEDVCKITDITLNMNRDAIDDTCIGLDARTFVKGLFSATGTANFIIDATDTSADAILNEIFATSAPKTIEIQLNSAELTSKAFSFAAIVTNVSPSVQVGDKTVASFSFQVTGPVAGTF